MAILGYVITGASTNVFNTHPNIIDWWYGYTNICVAFDTIPSNWVMPSLYCVFLILWVTMMILLWFRQKEAALAGQISKGWYWFLNYLRIQETLFAIYFCSSVAISPDLEDLAKGNAISMYVHTTPYLFMLIAFMTLALSDVLYDLYTGFASVKGLRHDKKASWGWYILAAYPFLLVPTMLFAQIQIVNVFAYPPTPLVPWKLAPELFANATGNPIYGNITIDSLPCITGDWPNDPTCSGYAFCSNCPNFTPAAGFMDQLKTFLAIIPPFLKSLIASIWFSDRIFRLNLTVTPHYIDSSIVADTTDDTDYVNLETK
jgi:hypothetical protein